MTVTMTPRMKSVLRGVRDGANYVQEHPDDLYQCETKKLHHPTVQKLNKLGCIMIVPVPGFQTRCRIEITPSGLEAAR